MKGKGFWVFVVLAVSMALFGTAIRYVHGGTPSEVVLRKGAAVIEAAKSSGIHWGNLFLFLAIAIPSMAILTRVIAWIAGRKTSVLVHATQILGDRRTAREVQAAKDLEAKLAGIEWVEPKVGKPFATYEEYKDCLLNGDLEEFVARCRAGVPQKTCAKCQGRVEIDLEGKMIACPDCSSPKANS